MKFTKATKKQSRARVALTGVSGSGKTWKALEFARLLETGKRTGVIDSERGSAAKYSDEFDFDHLVLESFGPEKYIEAIAAAEAEGLDPLIIDSLSHAWAGKDGVLEQADRGGGMTGGAWKKLTPLQNRMIDAILAYKGHVFVTLRSKTAYEFEKNDKGKIVPRKIGLAPIQRAEMEYEFDLFASIDADHNLTVEKTRCSRLDGKTYSRTDNPEIAKLLKEWLTDGAPVTNASSSVAANGASEASDSTSNFVAPTALQTAPCEPTRPAVEAVKAVFPGGTVVDAVREEALIEARRLIASELKWEIAQAKEAIRNLTGGKKQSTKELDRAEAIALRDHLRGLATANPEATQ